MTDVKILNRRLDRRSFAKSLGGGVGAAGATQRRLDGSLTHW